MPKLILNDLHAGVKRSGGTTPASALLLRAYLQESFARMLEDHKDKEVIINGDLFDAFEIDTQDWVVTYNTLASWLGNYGQHLTLIAGNHDQQPRGDKVSSFALLCHVLLDRFPNQVTTVTWDDGFTKLDSNLYVIPHMQNQDLFDVEISKAIEAKGAGHLLLHANFDNPFAAGADHSLNVSHEQAVELCKHYRLVFGHEHQHRVGINARVLVVGNQWPSSISDCISTSNNQKDGKKYAMVIHDDLGHQDIETWSAATDYVERDWRELGDEEHVRFVRIVGNALASEASDVINTVSRYRNASSAFVVSNAVAIEGVEGMGDFADMSLENIKSFDVLAALLEELSPEEGEIVKEMMND